MPSEKNNILKFNQYTKLENMSYIIYVDHECLVKRIEGCASNAQRSSTIKIGEHAPCRYSMSKIRRFHHIKRPFLISWERLYENVL